MKIFKSGVFEVEVLVLATELSDETGFVGLAECEINAGLESEDVNHCDFCNLTL